MLKFLKRFFGSNEDHDKLAASSSSDDNLLYSHGKKNNLDTECNIVENFYVHDAPDPPFKRNSTMPSKVEKHDLVDTTQVIIQDGDGERAVTMDEAYGQMERHAPGIAVPGMGYFGAPTQQQRPQQPQQQRPQQVQQRHQQPTQVQQRPQQVQQRPQQVQVQQPIQQPIQQPVQSPNQGGMAVPNVEMAMVDDAYHLFMDLAGVKRQDLSIEFEHDTLVITGKRESSLEKLKKDLKGQKARKNPIKSSNSTIPDFLMGDFVFEYPFKKMIDETNISANLEDGVLHVVLPHRTKGDSVKVALM